MPRSRLAKAWWQPDRPLKSFTASGHVFLSIARRRRRDFAPHAVAIARRLKQVVKVTRTQPLTPNSKHTFDERVSASSSSRIKLPNRYTTQLRSTRTSLPPCLRTSSLRSGRFTLRGDSFKGALCRVHMRFIHVLHQPNVKLPAQILDSPA